MWSLQRAAAQRILDEDGEEKQQQRLDFLASVPLLHVMPRTNLLAFVQNVEEVQRGVGGGERGAERGLWGGSRLECTWSGCQPPVTTGASPTAFPLRWSSLKAGRTPNDVPAPAAFYVFSS